MLNWLFSIESLYEGSKKYKIYRILGFCFRIKVMLVKNFRKFINDTKPRALDDIIDAPRERVKLSIAAIFKDETDIVEWIEYHKLIGVERFYLYDNESKNDYKTILQPYIDAGVVVYRRVCGQCQQRPVYRDAVYRSKDETDWLAIIDLDEYIVPVSTNDLKDFLKEFEGCCAVVVNWLMFDSNGLNKRNRNNFVIELFTRVYKNYDTPINRTIKTIVCPSKVRYVRSVHACIYKNNELAVDENRKPMRSKLYFRTDQVSMNKIRINHYHCKSKEEYLQKINKGFADQIKPRIYDETSLNFKETTHDYVIQKYVQELKKSKSI